MPVKQKMYIIHTGKNGNRLLKGQFLKFLDTISKVKGVGPQREKVFNILGIYSLRDMLYYFPRRHLDRTNFTPINKLKKGELVNVIGNVQTYGQKSIRKGKMFQVLVSDGAGLLTLNWFNGVRFIKSLFKVGDRIVIHGKVEWYNGFTITHPEFETILEEEDPIKTNNIVPIYPMTKELKAARIEQRILRNIIKEILNNIEDVDDFMPLKILKTNNLIGLEKALALIHFSSSLYELRQAKNRLKFDEHFLLQLLLALKKQSIRNSVTKRLIDIGPYFRPIAQTLDFELTNAQKNVIQEIHLDMKRDFPMNRLIQGDVGSGKTIVAVLISVLSVGNGVQVAIMAPTEILARQHYLSFREQLDKVNIACSLLIGKMKKKDRDPILGGLKKGKIPIVIGTHALIQDDILFKKLGLIIIDEQHRFGVDQRSALFAKGNNPHSISMTATPIPRTLAITYHGDMDISIIDELPKNRTPIITKVVKPNRMDRVYKFIRSEVDKGRQCIIVYPLVEQSEKLDLAAAVEAHSELSSIQFSKLNVGLIHGKMKSEKKDTIIKEFECNRINILVSTTVIEVGIDIPNATVMLVEHAERFGLTQLHQLRGRVGRSSKKSYCILVSRNFSDISKKRLSIMEETHDGFIIADEDLRLRGPGEFFGLRQSGFLKYKIANMVTDGKIIKSARKEAFQLIDNDNQLIDKKNYFLKQVFVDQFAEFLENINLS